MYSKKGTRNTIHNIDREALKLRIKKLKLFSAIEGSSRPVATEDNINTKKKSSSRKESDIDGLTFYNNKEMTLKAVSTVTTTLKSTTTDHSSHGRGETEPCNTSDASFRKLTDHLNVDSGRKTVIDKKSPNRNQNDIANNKYAETHRQTVVKGSNDFLRIVDESFEKEITLARNTCATYKNPPKPFQAIEIGKKLKRRKIMKPLTHIPYVERQIEESLFEFRNEDESEVINQYNNEAVRDIKQPEENQQKIAGAEHGVELDHGDDYDNIDIVYKNQEEIYRAEKPKGNRRLRNAKVFDLDENGAGSNDQRFNYDIQSSVGNTLDANLTDNKPLQKAFNGVRIYTGERMSIEPALVLIPKKRFDLAEIKRYLDQLEEYEQTIRTTRRDNPIEIAKEVSSCSKCLVF